jgi:hypothetical protein
VATAGIALVAHNGFGILKVSADNFGSGEHSGNLSRPCSSVGRVGLSPTLYYCTTNGIRIQFAKCTNFQFFSCAVCTTRDRFKIALSLYHFTILKCRDHFTTLLY